MPQDMPDLVPRLYAMKRELEDIIDSLDDTQEPVPVDGTGKKLAVVVGHTERSPGAYGQSPISQNEYFWNRDVAARMKEHADTKDDISAQIFLRDHGGIEGAYGRAGEWGADACVELHFNAAVPTASGTETIYATDISEPLAEALQNAIVAVMELRDRGIKEPWEGRGRASLTQLSVPSVIVEPFFGSNPDDCERATERKVALAAALVDGASAILNA